MTTKRFKRDLSQLLSDIGPIDGPSRPGVALRQTRAAVGEAALVLDVRRLQLLGVFQDGSMGQLVWGTAGQIDRPTALYSYTAETLTIHEVVRGGSLDKIDVSLDVDLLSVFSRSGSRPWLTCPNRKDGEACGRRAARLLLVDGETEFKCRVCIGRRRSLRLRLLTNATSHTLAARPRHR